MIAGASSACEDCLRRAWLVADLAGHLERARRSHAHLPEVLALEDADLLEAVGGRDAGPVRRRWRAFDATAARAACAAARVGAVCRHAEAWPRRLTDAPDAPRLLFWAGRDGALTGLSSQEAVIAVVGSRRPSPYGVEVARALGRGLAVAGVPVVSGMALGIDSAAQAGALDGGGLTVAVLAGGADVAYPRSKRHLHGRIVSAGAVVSEQPPGTMARRWCFPARNRIIAGLADLTVVVEATERSGSLITADLAVRLGREVGAVPGRVTAAQAQGTNALLRDGAILVRDARDAVEALLGAGAADHAPAERGSTLEAPLQALLTALRCDGDPVEAAGGSAERALAGLAELEVRGLARRVAGGRYEPVAT